MPNYLRLRISGVPEFFTGALARRGGDGRVREVGALKEAVTLAVR